MKRGFDELCGYECLGVCTSFTTELKQSLKFTPELVVINFDAIAGDPLKIMELINKTFGIIPNYIALTVCYKKAFMAYKYGVSDVIDKPLNVEEIEKAIQQYHSTHFPSKLFCVQYYYDYRYLYLDDIVLLKADNYTTDLLLRDGTTVNNFETLKRTHLQLPENFQRVHRSFVVNSYYVKRIDYGSKEINLRNYGKSIQFSKTYLGNVQTIKKILTEPQNPFLN